MIEALGYAATAIVTVSLMMRSIVRLRWINLVGSIAFTVYGVAISAAPVVVLNLAIVGINLYHLWRMRRAHESFAVVRMPPTSDYVRNFVEFHRADIARSQPSATVPPDATVLFVLRDTVPAGVIALDPPTSDGTGRVRLDYATPAYRDLRIGRFLFRHGGPLPDLGYRRLLTQAETADQRRYLASMGFTPSPQGHVRDLTAPAVR